MVLFTATRDHWMSDAACVGAAPLFDPDADDSLRESAVAICRRQCPVRQQCQAWAEAATYSGVAAGSYYRQGIAQPV